MGPSSRAAWSRPEYRWLRRQDSNLQSPDPESGALPIWPLLSAAPQNITNGHHARHLASELRTRETSLVFVGRLQRLQKIRDEILEFGLLDFERDLERALERDSGSGIELRFLQ